MSYPAQALFESGLAALVAQFGESVSLGADTYTALVVMQAPDADHHPAERTQTECYLEFSRADLGTVRFGPGTNLAGEVFNYRVTRVQDNPGDLCVRFWAIPTKR